MLGIESSCDDTGVAVVTASGRVLGQSLATQTQIHAPWGGVVPKLAQEAHEAAINGCVEAALAEAGVTPDQLAAVAVTIGPGLSLCLRVSGSAFGGLWTKRYSRLLIAAAIGGSRREGFNRLIAAAWEAWVAGWLGGAGGAGKPTCQEAAFP